MWTEAQQAMLKAMGLPMPMPMPLALALAPVPTPAPAPIAAAAAPTPAADAAPAPQRRAPVQRGDLALLDADALHAAIVACSACPLAASRLQALPGTAHAPADWLVLGEAPTEADEKHGEPFAGAAGELLDQMLAALGLLRTGSPGAAAAAPAGLAFLSNAVKCRPPRQRNVQPAELAQCEPLLLRQIELLRPRVLLAMGPLAVQALLHSDEPLGRLRGRVHHVQGLPLVVTYAPSYLLRHPADKAGAWNDLCMAADAAAAHTG